MIFDVVLEVQVVCPKYLFSFLHHGAVLILANHDFHVKNITCYMWNYVKSYKGHRAGSYIIHVTARIFNEVPSSLTLFLDRLYFAIVTIYFTRLRKLPAIKSLSSIYKGV